jgi:hypothetical protein
MRPYNHHQPPPPQLYLVVLFNGKLSDFPVIKRSEFKIMEIKNEAAMYIR